MYIKKSPKIALEDKKFTYLLIGFILALSLIYISLEWTKKEIEVYEKPDAEFFFEEELDIVQTAETPPPPPPPPVEKVIEVLNIVEDTEEVEAIDIKSTEDDVTETIEIKASVPVTDVEEEDEEVIFQVVEQMPGFPGGNEALFKYLSNNMRYPVVAQENGIQGRVICQFVVNRDGSIVDIVVVRSVDPGLDKEAIRVIQSMPKWTPGQQRGKSVRVKYTLPVLFKLQ